MKRIFAVLFLFALLLGACAPAASAPTQSPATEISVPANSNLILATTTSTQDSGLLDVLVPMFEKQSGYVVKTIAVGSGEAMKMGEEGNADVLLVHAPASEAAFMETGNGTDRFLVMHNDFIIVGPTSDPAGIKGMTSAVDAFTAIFEAGSAFIADSRRIVCCAHCIHFVVLIRVSIFFYTKD